MKRAPSLFLFSLLSTFLGAVTTFADTADTLLSEAVKSHSLPEAVSLLNQTMEAKISALELSPNRGNDEKTLAELREENEKLNEAAALLRQQILGQVDEGPRRDELQRRFDMDDERLNQIWQSVGSPAGFGDGDGPGPEGYNAPPRTNENGDGPGPEGYNAPPRTNENGENGYRQNFPDAQPAGEVNYLSPDEAANLANQGNYRERFSPADTGDEVTYANIDDFENLNNPGAVSSGADQLPNPPTFEPGTPQYNQNFPDAQPAGEVNYLSPDEAADLETQGNYQERFAPANTGDDVTYASLDDFENQNTAGAEQNSDESAYDDFADLQRNPAADDTQENADDSFQDYDDVSALDFLDPATNSSDGISAADRARGYRQMPGDDEFVEYISPLSDEAMAEARRIAENNPDVIGISPADGDDDLPILDIQPGSETEKRIFEIKKAQAEREARELAKKEAEEKEAAEAKAQADAKKEAREKENQNKRNRS